MTCIFVFFCALQLYYVYSKQPMTLSYTLTLHLTMVVIVIFLDFGLLHYELYCKLYLFSHAN